MERVVFNEDARQLFLSAGLERVSDFVNYADGQAVNKNSKRHVVAFDLGQGDATRRFFMKRFVRPHFKDMLSSLRSFGRPCSQAHTETSNAEFLLENGIETYHPVCYGEQTVWGVEKVSFFVTSRIEGKSMTDFITKNWSHIPNSTQATIFADIGKLVRKLHQARISMPDLYIWHIFLLDESDSNGNRFALIDLHRMIRNTHSQHARLRDLAALFYSLPPRYFGEELKQAFLGGYLPDNSPIARDRLLAQIERRAEKITRRRSNPERTWGFLARQS